MYNTKLQCVFKCLTHKNTCLKDNPVIFFQRIFFMFSFLLRFKCWSIYYLFLSLRLFSQPSLNGSEWLMILRWIAERNSSGSAGPQGGPGPPIAGFLMGCPWHPRYPLCSCTSSSGDWTSIKHLNFPYVTTWCLCVELPRCTIYLHSCLTLLIYFLFVTDSNRNRERRTNYSSSTADGFRNVPVHCWK